MELNDLVLRKVFENTKEWRAGKLGTNWEGPYKIVEIVKPGVYRLETSTGEPIPRAWNASNLRKYYTYPAAVACAKKKNVERMIDHPLSFGLKRMTSESLLHKRRASNKHVTFAPRRTNDCVLLGQTELRMA